MTLYFTKFVLDTAAYLLSTWHFQKIPKRTDLLILRNFCKY